MNKIATLLMTTAAIAFAAPTFAADKTEVKSESSIDHKDNGGYEKTSTAEKITPSGKVSAETNVDLTVDDDGDKERVTTTKQVNDPKGLFNKETVKTETTEKLEDGKTTVESEKTVNGKTVAETKKSW